MCADLLEHRLLSKWVEENWFTQGVVTHRRKCCHSMLVYMQKHPNWSESNEGIQTLVNMFCSVPDELKRRLSAERHNVSPNQRQNTSTEIRLAATTQDETFIVKNSVLPYKEDNAEPNSFYFSTEASDLSKESCDPHRGSNDLSRELSDLNRESHKLNRELSDLGRKLDDSTQTTAKVLNKSEHTNQDSDESLNDITSEQFNQTRDSQCVSDSKAYTEKS